MSAESDRQAQIARIKQIERIKQMEGNQGDGPSTMEQIADLGGKTLQGAGKTLDTTAALPRAGLAKLLEMTTGKKVFNSQELSDAYNPTNLKTYPNSDELFKRAGVKEGTHLSDLLPSAYEEPASGYDRWYVPNKGGMLDPSVRGTGGFLTDAALDVGNLISFGAKRAAQEGLKTAAKAAAESGAKQAAERSTWGALKSALPAAEEAAAKAAPQATDAVIRGGNAINKGIDAMVQFPSRIADWAGKKLYGSSLGPIKDAADNAGKDAVETYNKYGIKGSGQQIREQAMAQAGKLKTDRDAILQAANTAKGQVDIHGIMKEYSNYLTNLVQEGRISLEDAQGLAKDLFTRFGKEGTVNPLKATNFKTQVNKSLPSKFWDELADAATKTEARAKFSDLLKNRIEGAVQAAGQDAGKFKDLNSDLGTFLSTRKAARTNARQDAKAAGISLKDLAILMGPSYVSPAAGGSLFGAKKAYDLVGPARVKSYSGWGLMKSARNPVSGTLLDAIVRQGTRDALQPPTPEEEDPSNVQKQSYP